MPGTLKPYFLGGFSKDLREKYTNTSSKDLPKRAEKMALRLDGAQLSIGGYHAEATNATPLRLAANRLKN